MLHIPESYSSMAGRDKLVSTSLHLSWLVLAECYQFLANLPLLVASVLAGLPYHPITAPRPDTLLVLGLERLVAGLDLAAGEAVTLLEFHVVLTPAAVLAILLQRWALLASIQDRMDRCYTRGEAEAEQLQEEEVVNEDVAQFVSDLVDEIIEDTVKQEVDLTECEVATPRKIEQSPLKFKFTPRQNESGYLSELETSLTN